MRSRGAGLALAFALFAPALWADTILLPDTPSSTPMFSNTVLGYRINYNTATGAIASSQFTTGNTAILAGTSATFTWSFTVPLDAFDIVLLSVRPNFTIPDAQIVSSVPYPPRFTPAFPSTPDLPSTYTFTITSGGTTRTVTGPNIASYEMLRNGFSFTPGTPANVTVTFGVPDVTDTVTADLSAFHPVSVTGMKVDTLQLQVIGAYLDGANSNVGFMQIPEPVTFPLAAGGLMVIGSLIWRRFRRRSLKA